MLGAIFIFTAMYSASALGLGVYVTLPVLVVHTMVIPLAFRFSKTIQQKIVFSNVNWPFNTNVEQPVESGIDGARNLYIQHESKVDQQTIKIGVWHILPTSSIQRLNETNAEREMDILYDEELAAGKPIILYCHGNSNNRAAKSRIKLYQVLQNMDFHVIAFDYRGYGDSTHVRPTERGVVEDLLVVYDWLLKKVHHASSPPHVYIWGHSLGTAISSHLVGNLRELSTSHLDRAEGLPQPRGLILEAPFNNFTEEVANHFMMNLVFWLPYFEATFVRPFSRSDDYKFESDRHLAKADSLPILILHAEDDHVVPYKLGIKLLKAVSTSRSENGAPVGLQTFGKSLKLGHKWICMSEELPQMIRDFMNGLVPENTQLIQSVA